MINMEDIRKISAFTSGNGLASPSSAHQNILNQERRGRPGKETAVKAKQTKQPYWG